MTRSPRSTHVGAQGTGDGTLTVASFNVNGIRAAYKRGFATWLAHADVDVVCLQEVRAPDSVLRDLVGPDWHVAHHESTVAGAKGRAGVAILTPVAPIETQTSLCDTDFDGHGRWVETTLDLPSGPVIIVSVYVHSGEAGHPRQQDKYRFLDAMTKRLAELADQRAIICGDVNIAHTNDDLKNWKGNLKNAGCLPEERAYLDVWVGEQSWCDVIRHQVGQVPGPHTWWSWRGQAFDNDSGWRIDYHYASPQVADRVVGWRIDRAPDYASRISDHAPVVVSYRI